MFSPFPFRPAVLAVAVLCAAGAQVQALAQTRAFDFDIPAGDLKPAIDRFARETGAQIFYKADDVQGLATKGVRGRRAEDEALRELLDGSTLTFKRDGTRALVIFRPGADAGNGTATAAATLASAGDAGSARADDAISALDTVTVTAQRRPEAAQSVPIALTSFSGATLDTYRVSSLQDVSRLTPGLLVSAFSVSNPTIAIRGANNTFSQMGVSKPVAVVVDDVFVPRNGAASFELFDLESLTVLKGPQGTLFGRNVTGGAIVMNTRKPVFNERSAKTQLTLGNFGAVNVDALANLPVGDDQAIKLSVATRDRDGTGRDRLTGRDQDDLQSRNVRGQWRAALGADVDALVSVDYGEDSSGGRTLSSVTLGDDGDRRTSEVGVPQGFDRTLWGTSAKLEWTRPWGEITSITAFRHSKSREDYSGVGANYALLTTGAQAVTRDAERVGTWSQELRYASPRWDAGHLQAGVFFLDEDGSRRLGQQSFAARTGALTASTLADQQVRTRSASVFADGTWHWTSTVDLTAGARYTYDHKTASLDRADLVRPTAGFSAHDLRASWSEWTPRVALNWQPSRQMLLYASVTRGFTAGGFNTDASSLAALATPFNPETVTNREVGLKSQWLDNRLRVNLSVFDMAYRDKQEFVNNTVTGILSIINASRATVRGAEMEVAWKPVKWLGLSATYGYLDGSYDRFEIGNINYTGNPLASSPKNKASVAADWRIPVRDGFAVGAVNYGWQSDYNTGAANDPNLQIPGYGLLNFNAGFEAADRRWRVVAWVKNATNRAYILTRSTQVVRAEYLGDPRTFGVTAAFRF
ncbi:TonB-dependent receptor domain-containing protein [Roseateles chitinivorans]|uniref:TonB-dependent receptor domain-containing protein n=1 Tax=Roseateles chitinivorans TaxID=2917965 RepID=UPI003D678132